MNGHIFISHASEDAAKSREIVDYLEARGVKCWISSRDIKPPIEWAEAIVTAMRGASACIVVVSKSSRGAAGLKRELDLADEAKAPLIPIMLDGVQPDGALAYYLRSPQQIQYWRDKERALDDFIAAQTGQPPPPQQRRPPRRVAALVGGGLFAICAIGGVAWFVVSRSNPTPPRAPPAPAVTQYSVRVQAAVQAARNAEAQANRDRDLALSQVTAFNSMEHAAQRPADYAERVLAPGFYRGQVIDGRPQGIGEFLINSGPSTGDRYIGQWRDGLMEGYGVFYYANNEANAEEGGDARTLQYSGRWLRQQTLGYGVLERERGEHYAGQFSQPSPNESSVPHGYGVYVRTINGHETRYEGHLVSSRFDGPGVRRRTDHVGPVESGCWSADELVDPNC